MNYNKLIPIGITAVGAITKTVKYAREPDVVFAQGEPVLNPHKLPTKKRLEKVRKSSLQSNGVTTHMSRISEKDS